MREANPVGLIYVNCIALHTWHHCGSLSPLNLSDTSSEGLSQFLFDPSCWLVQHSSGIRNGLQITCNYLRTEKSTLCKYFSLIDASQAVLNPHLQKHFVTCELRPDSHLQITFLYYWSKLLSGNLPIFSKTDTDFNEYRLQLLKNAAIHWLPSLFLSRSHCSISRFSLLSLKSFTKRKPRVCDIPRKTEMYTKDLICLKTSRKQINILMASLSEEGILEIWIARRLLWFVVSETRRGFRHKQLLLTT